ncbi:hypothetical protein JT358_00330 [Micrococcales bacterium 31B]|nr:hypothetical protein [Micrococcales bacterium 31B]
MFTLEEALAALEEWGGPEPHWSEGAAATAPHSASLQAARFFWWQTAAGTLDAVHYVQSTRDPVMADAAFAGANALLHRGGLERRPSLPPSDERPRFENQVREQGWFQWERGGAWHYGPLGPGLPAVGSDAQVAWLAYGSHLRETCRNYVAFEPFGRIVAIPEIEREPRRREVVVNVLRDVLAKRPTRADQGEAPAARETSLRDALRAEADTFHAIAELEHDDGEVSLARHLADQALEAYKRL